MVETQRDLGFFIPKNFTVILLAKKRLILALVTGIILFFSTISGNSLDKGFPAVPSQKEDTKVEQTLRNREEEQNNLPITAEAVVRAYFSDLPILADVAWCESRFRHFDREGNLFRGEINNQDVGVMQINERYHLDRSKKLGFDIGTIKGNMAYARYLYEENGLKPWLSSSNCWKTPREIAKR